MTAPKKFKRRDALKLGLGTVASLAFSKSYAVGFSSVKKRKFSDEFITLDAVSQALLIRNKKVSAEELTRSAINRIERLNPSINAVISTFYDEAISHAQKGLPNGPFSGVPYLIKDLVDYKSHRTTQGSRMFMGNLSESSHVYIDAAQNAGFNILGKTNTPEFGIMPTTEPLAFGPTANPWNLACSPGGSSGGAAAAVASGMVPIAQGSDGGGSIRIPASCCGLFGLKVSRRRNVWPGKLSVRGFDVKGHLSRTVRDTAVALAATEWQGDNAHFPPVGVVKSSATKRLKIGLVMESMTGQSPDDDVKEATLSTAYLCQKLGHHVEDVNLPFDQEKFTDAFLLVMSEGVGNFVNYMTQKMGRKPNAQELEPWTLYLADYYNNYGGSAAVENAAKYCHEITEQMEVLFKSYDVLLSPVLTKSPIKTGEQSPIITGDKLKQAGLDYIGYTPLYNATGQPAMSVPLNWNSQGLPIGSQFATKLGGEQTLLALAYELEQARPWKNKWAPNSAFYL